MLKNNGVRLEISDFALDYICELGYDPQFGARPLKRVIQKKVLNELSKMILAEKVDRNRTILLDYMGDDQLVFRNVESSEEAEVQEAEVIE